MFVEVGERGVEHADHVVEVLSHLAMQPRFLNLFDAQLEPRKGRAQVMGYRSEHASALLHLFTDLALHQVERLRSLPGFFGADDLQCRAVEIFTEPLGCLAKALYRAGQRFGAVPRGNNQGDELKEQQYQRTTRRRPVPLPSIVLCMLRIRAVFRGRAHAVLREPDERQQVREHDRQQRAAEQSGK